MPKKKPRTIPQCGHPGSKHYARGKCYRCWSRDYWKAWKARKRAEFYRRRKSEREKALWESGEKEEDSPCT